MESDGIFRIFKRPGLSLEGDTVAIGRPGDISPNERATIEKAAQALIPWRKGPFNLFGIEIDGEWRSCLKWNRMKDKLPPLEGKTILDIGCNNGYFMFKMMAQRPQFVLGIDPTLHFKNQFKFLQTFFQNLPVGLRVPWCRTLALDETLI